MTKRKQEVNDPDNPEWTEEKFARSLKFKDLPASLQRTLSKPKRGPQKAPTKAFISLRIDQDVLERFKADGPGWQSRINDALRKAIAG